MTTQTVPLHRIAPNPWQPRQAMDPAGIEELALSIARDGLMQVPVARVNPDNPVSPDTTGMQVFQLALGHRRLEAFKLLAKVETSVRAHWDDHQPFDGSAPEDEKKLIPAVWAALKAGRTFQEIPLDVQEFTDRQMFELAVQENLQRQDLNPIEQAAAEKRYMEEFKVSSEGAGHFFGRSGATIRGDVRLLDLPVDVQAKLATGEITVGSARKLLVIQRVSGKDAIKKAAKALVQNDVDTEHIIERELHDGENTIEMWSSWRHDGDDHSHRAGYGLWLLSTPPAKLPNSLLPVMKWNDALKLLGKESTADNRAMIEKWMSVLQHDASHAHELINNGAPEDDIDRLLTLLDPPACTACQFYARAGHDDYCAFKACHSRKVTAWCKAELARMVKKTGIPAYDPASDGKEIFILNNGWNDNGKSKKLFEDHTDLRLQISYTSNQGQMGQKHSFTDSFLVRAVAVGATAKKQIEKRRKENAERNKAYDNTARERQWKIERENKSASDKLLKLARDIFAPTFAGLAMGPLSALLGNEKINSKDKPEYYQQQAAARALGAVCPWSFLEKGPLTVAKRLQETAKAWGVKLPADWFEIAQGLTEGLEEYEGLDGKLVKAAVSTATEAK